MTYSEHGMNRKDERIIDSVFAVQRVLTGICEEYILKDIYSQLVAVDLR